jgi:hypothetical protein
MTRYSRIKIGKTADGSYRRMKVLATVVAKSLTACFAKSYLAAKEHEPVSGGRCFIENNLLKIKPAKFL